MEPDETAEPHHRTVWERLGITTRAQAVREELAAEQTAHAKTRDQLAEAGEMVAETRADLEWAWTNGALHRQLLERVADDIHQTLAASKPASDDEAAAELTRLKAARDRIDHHLNNHYLYDGEFDQAASDEERRRLAARALETTPRTLIPEDLRDDPEWGTADFFYPGLIRRYGLDRQPQAVEESRDAARAHSVAGQLSAGERAPISAHIDAAEQGWDVERPREGLDAAVARLSADQRERELARTWDDGPDRRRPAGRGMTL
ncbi:MAG: hypothetical protein ACRD0K_06705 [Egibacteraceae bacterium]